MCRCYNFDFLVPTAGQPVRLQQRAALAGPLGGRGPRQCSQRTVSRHLGSSLLCRTLRVQLHYLELLGHAHGLATLPVVISKCNLQEGRKVRDFMLYNAFSYYCFYS